MKNRGFTLIELVVVLVLVGILAAVALPRFIDLGDRARAAANAGVAGAFESGLNLAASGHRATAPRSTLYPFGTSGYTLTFPIDSKPNLNGTIKIAQWPTSASLGGQAPDNEHVACANLFNAFVSGSLAQEGSSILEAAFGAPPDNEALTAFSNQLTAAGVNYVAIDFGIATSLMEGLMNLMEPSIVNVKMAQEGMHFAPNTVCMYTRADTLPTLSDGDTAGGKGFFYHSPTGTVAQSIEELIAKISSGLPALPA